MTRQVLAIGMAALLTAAALVPATRVSAASGANHATYRYILGEQNAPLPLFGPDVAMAPDGRTVGLTGDGFFNAGPNKSISGGGTYTIWAASGAVLASGRWTATTMLSFVSYGPATPQGLPPIYIGGQVQLMVTLVGVGSGQLNVNCTLGTPPPGHSDPAMEEGIDLRVGNGLTFNREVFGQNLIIGPV
jgi:hypothetical protein